MKFVLTRLSALSRTFQAANLNFCRIILSIHITKGRIDEVVKENKAVKELEKHVKARLELFNLSMDDKTREMLQEWVKKYSKAIRKNIDDSFPPESLAILESFSFGKCQTTPVLQLLKYTDNQRFLQLRSTFTGKQKQEMTSWNNGMI